MPVSYSGLRLHVDYSRHSSNTNLHLEGFEPNRRIFHARWTHRRAYRRVSLSVHPDKGGDPKAFRRLSRAHDVLRDPGLREL